MHVLLAPGIQYGTFEPGTGVKKASEFTQGLTDLGIFS